jgi:hypothetical protein
MPFKDSADPQDAVQAGEEPNLDSLWSRFAREVEGIYRQTSEDSGLSVQQALRHITHETYNQLVYDEDFLAAFTEGSDPDLCELPVNVVPLFDNDQIKVGLMSVYRNCGVVPLHDHPGAYGVTLILSGIAKVSYASVIERDPDNTMVRLKVERVRERLPGQVCWFFDGEQDLHSIEAATSSAQLLVIQMPNVETANQAFYYPANQQSIAQGGTTIAKRVPVNQS